MRIKDLIWEAHANAKDKGWYNGGARNIPEALALIHSEVSEALEDYRSGCMESAEVVGAPGSVPKPIGFPIELADIAIRLFDLCGYLKIDLEAAIEKKMTYNTTRSFRHGSKVA